MLLAGLLSIYSFFFIEIKCTFRSGGNLFTPQETKNETDTAQFKKNKYTQKKINIHVDTF
jgi:hypothetical protein